MSARWYFLLRTLQHVCCPTFRARVRSETDFLFGADENGLTLLHHAARAGRTGVVKWLVRHATNIHARDKNGATPLLVAVVGNHVAVVR